MEEYLKTKAEREAAKEAWSERRYGQSGTVRSPPKPAEPAPAAAKTESIKKIGSFLASELGQSELSGKGVGLLGGGFVLGSLIFKRWHAARRLQRELREVREEAMSAKSTAKAHEKETKEAVKELEATKSALEKEQQRAKTPYSPPPCDATKFPFSSKDPALWQARIDLAAIYRLCHNHSFNEGICNHLTVMAPNSTDKFLVIPYGLMWSEVTASNLLLVDQNNKVLEGEGEAEDTAFHIHKEIHMADPVKNVCVLHTHQPYPSALCCLEDPTLYMCHQNCLRFWNDVAYDPTFNGLVLEENEGKRLARFMGDKRVYMHSNHGVIVVGASCAEAWDDLYYFDRACEVQIIAMTTGKPLKMIGEEVAKGFKEDMDKGKAGWAKNYFEAAKRDLVKQGKDADFCS